MKKLWFNSTGSTPDPMVSCVVVNWNGWQDTMECLRSLRQQQYPALRVFVVDNASSDDSVERIRAACPEVEMIEAGRNGGFAAGCNVGIREALARGAEFVWLLNNDTVAPPDTLDLLVAAAATERIGIVGTVLRYLHEPSRIQAWGGGQIVRWLGYVRHYRRPVRFGGDSYLTFASVLIRREVFEQIGLLDEGYFMYFEDSDFCFRAWRAGWTAGMAESTAVLHKEGGSVAVKKSPAMERIVTRSGLRFVGLHAPLPWVARMLFVLSKLAKRALRRDAAGIRAVLLGVADWRSGRAIVLRKDAR